MTSSIIGLLNNVALLLVAGFIFDMLGEYSRAKKLSFRQFFVGVILGCIGLGVMSSPWELSPGLIFDARSILLSVSGLFFGTIPTLIAVLFTVLLRLSIGGTGALPGVAVIITSGLLGLVWRHLRKNELDDISIRELYVFGIVVHINMLLWMFTLPWPLSITTVSEVGLPVMVIHPTGTALLGWLFIGRMARIRTENALLRSERQLRILADNLPAYVAHVDLKELRYRFVNSKFVDSYKISREEIIGSHIKEIIGEENFEYAKPYIERVRRGQPASYENSFVTAGTKRWVNVNYVPDVGESGEVESIIVLSHDITERRQIEETLRESENRYRMLFERASDAIFLVNTKSGFYLDANKAGEELTGRSVDELRKTTIYEVTPNHVNERTRKISEAEVGTTMDMGEVAYVRPDGTERITLLNTVLISDRLIFGLAHDITEQKKSEIIIHEVNERLRNQLVEIKELEIALREQAVRDPLTGLFNRRYMEETLNRELAKAKRDGGVLSLVLLDLDYLKEVNESYGHIEGGDKALKALAERIQSLCRLGDTFCRYAGDEFVIILEDTALDVAYQRVMEWKKAVSEIQINNRFGISFSAGIAEFPIHGEIGEVLIQSADRALYKAKGLGRDQVVVFA